MPPFPPNAAKVSAGCSGDNLSKTETMIENMADGEGKMMAQPLRRTRC